MMNFDAHDVSVALAERIGDLVRDLLPNGRAQGDSWRVGSLRGEEGGSLSIALTEKPGLWFDHNTREKGDALSLVKGVRHCDTREAIEWSKKWLGLDSGEARATPAAPKAGDGADEERRVQSALAIWNEAIPPRHTLVEAYLRRRALELPGAIADEVIRYHRACPWSDEDTGKIIRVPAMIAAMRSIATDKITAIHRTRLSPEGEKMRLSPGGKKIKPRMLGVATGAAVKLDADERVTDSLIIGEGIETCMTARQIGLGSTWALGSAGAIAAFPVLGGVDTLMILAEPDEANRRAREACGTRWDDAGREVIINIPKIGNDLNDTLRVAKLMDDATQGPLRVVKIVNDAMQAMQGARRSSFRRRAG